MYLRIFSLCCVMLTLGACAVNPATGQRQFTALMSPAQEAQIGKQEHPKILATFGGEYKDKSITSYVNQIGQDLVKGTEQPGQRYRFTVLDSPVVNAFATPGGYVYITRGLMALANSEAELAGVIGHEIGHITGRHSAERYSQAVVTGLLGAVVTQSLASDIPQIGNVTSLGSDLFLKSYSRGQELQSDNLGMRYMARQGYDPFAIVQFLESMQMEDQLQAKLGAGGKSAGFDFFSTHPQTGDRIAKASAAARSYALTGKEKVNAQLYLQKLNGMTYGASPDEGYVRGQVFVHPKLGFMFQVPNGFKIQNRSSEVLATDGTASVIFDGAKVKNLRDPVDFLTGVWASDVTLNNVERITINGRRAATGSLRQNARKGPVDIRLVAIHWSDNLFYRFAFVTPVNRTAAYADVLRRTTHSFRSMSKAEMRKYPPLKLRVVQVKSGDTVQGFARKMAFDEHQEERFRVLNRLRPGQSLKAGQWVKIVTEG